LLVGTEGSAAARDGEAGFESARYNPGDFSHSILVGSAELHRASEAMATHVHRDGGAPARRAAIDVAVRVAKALAPYLKALDCTDDFVSFVFIFDDTSENRRRLARRTIPPSRFERIARSRPRETLSSRSRVERAAFWLRVLAEHFIQQRNDTARATLSRRVTVDDGLAALATLRKESVAPATLLLERFAPRWPSNERAELLVKTLLEHLRGCKISEDSKTRLSELAARIEPVSSVAAREIASLARRRPGR
jgi:hypothetical protein